VGKGAKGGSSLGFFLFTRENVTGLVATGPEPMTTSVASGLGWRSIGLWNSFAVPFPTGRATGLSWPFVPGQ